MLRIFDTRYHHGDGFEESSCLSIFTILVLISVIVVSVTYAAYLFIHASGISNIAGIHISQNLKLASKSAQGELYTNAEKGIKDWIIYNDANIGFSVKYPNNLVMVKNSNEFEIKKISANSNSNLQSMAYSFVIGKISKDEDSSALEQMKTKYPFWDGTSQSGIYGGKEGLRTGVFKSIIGINKELIYWEKGTEIIYLESRYYSENNVEYRSFFDEIVSEFNIM